jgi:predicted transcriptional regulator
MDDHHVDWVAVVDDGRVAGWVDGSQLNGQASVGEVEVRPFALTLRQDDSLREALDTLITSPTRVAVVVDDDQRYLGMIDVARIGEGVT